MKILKGSLKETLYAWPDQSLIKQGISAPPAVVKETIYNANEVAYVSGMLFILFSVLYATI